MAKNKNNRRCIICGKEYSYCPVCGQDAKKPSWYTIFCGDNCNEIYEAVTTYRDGGCSIEAARDVLNGLDLSAVDNEGFNVTTRKQVKEILGEADVAVAVEVVSADEEAEVSEVVSDEPKIIMEEVTIEEKPEVKHENKYYGKNNFYKNNNKK